MMEPHHKEKPVTEGKKGVNLILALALAALVLMVINQVQLLNIKESGGRPLLPPSSGGGVASVSPTGVPRIYGDELGIAYDDVNPNDPQRADTTIGILKRYDETLTLQGGDLERYIAIASQISCEYCCGAASIITRPEDVAKNAQQIEAAIAAGKITAQEAEAYKQKAGDAACGCAHSYAMRGLLKYLIKNHPTEFTDDEMLEELAKWKTLFFPGQMAAKAQVLKEKGIPFSYVNLGSNKYRGIEKGATAGSGMVGGC